ncbi:transposable element tc3 transposase [Trichonephila clavipes]|nr:transposable element tc3 transposase [Trichonephila clavipes]
MKFEQTGNLGVLPERGRKPVGTETVKEVTTAMVERASSSLSIYFSTNGRSISCKLEIPRSTIRKIMRYTLKRYPYKIHVMQTLKPQDQKTRLEFACRFLARMQVHDAWPLKILLSDKAHFYLDGAVNTQNCRIPKRCSVTSPRYSGLLQQQVIPALQERQCLQTTIFMQDGASPQAGHQVKALLSADFGDNRILSRHFLDVWPSHSPDLQPCDFWLWGFLKDHVYSGGIRTLSDLKASIILCNDFTQL